LASELDIGERLAAVQRPKRAIAAKYAHSFHEIKVFWILNVALSVQIARG
jgi:hypothetical protein